MKKEKLKLLDSVFGNLNQQPINKNKPMNEIELLEYKIDNLTEMVKTLTSVTKDIYQQLGISDKLTEQKLQPKTEPVLVKKTTINWDGLVKAVAGTKSEEFVLNVYNNGYPTLTEKQYDVLVQISEQNDIPLNA